MMDTSIPWTDPVALCSYVLPEKCCHTFLVDFNFTDEQCIKTSVSKFIGIGIIIGSTLVKMPQVIKISQAKSSVGISFWGVLLELMAITFNTAYSFQRGYPFSAWGEALFILIETGIIAFLVLWYTPNRSGALAFLLSISSTIYILTFGITPINVLWYLQACNLPLAGNENETFFSFKEVNHIFELSDGKTSTSVPKLAKWPYRTTFSSDMLVALLGMCR